MARTRGGGKTGAKANRRPDEEQGHPARSETDPSDADMNRQENTASNRASADKHAEAPALMPSDKP